MKAYVGVEVRFHSFLALILSGREWSTSLPGCFTYGKKALDPLNKGMGEPCNWVRHFGQKINLLALPGIKQFLGQPSCSLCYPGFHVITCKNKTHNAPSHQSLSHLTTFKSPEEFSKNTKLYGLARCPYVIML
jgi:hypothetical protein